MDLFEKLARRTKTAQDPMMGGGMPMDPAAGGMPMDPMAGGAMPGGAAPLPLDPAMMGAGAPTPTADELMGMSGMLPAGDPAAAAMEAPVPEPAPVVPEGPDEAEIARAEALAEMGKAVNNLTTALAEGQATLGETISGVTDKLMETPAASLVPEEIAPMMEPDEI